ncbi:Zn-binding Pro-Ala-Ala-Arg (PAAR) domain-containing protein, incolved in TypeVI secretion [Modicisalibacter muralis]|uniref:Zn-binding Pro-Ala-Ala-Arg (PAAR) domain-containing protein, incolved in TypeVI secretion n=1 Tax=Modicisalibacter muralis TaxID=119000 RepID=A0A1G9ELW6_9GAMM|nr:PAAR domain-containing protein [Halomonas muralis]SDK77041.1 Zn-binding Pro-Ala-Ala-Arg (PAAR) domain-containing protein, incolved in TypeVI secretion [Halomonas muralis]
MDLAKIGDKVVCKCNGGPHKIVSGASTVFVDDIPAARIGDMSSCGATITTGADWFEIEDSPAAINGSQTSCGGKVITGSSVTTGSPTSIEIGGFRFQQSAPADSAMTTDAIDDAIAASGAPASQASAQPTTAFSATAATAPIDDDDTSGVAPGFHIVERPMSGRELEAELLGRAKPEAIDKFRALNPHLAERAKPGQMAVLSDPDNLQCTAEDARLRDAANRVDAALASLSDEDARFMVENYDAIGAFLDYSSAGVGAATAMVGKHLTTVERTLRSIEQLHQRSFAEHGNLNNPDFFAKRRRLFTQLNGSLGPLVRRGIGFPDHPSLRHALGISTRSLTHHWREGGVSDIPGYATHIDGVARAAKYIKAGGWIGVGLGGVASYARVQEACTTGREDQCGRVKYTEAGKFIGGVGGGALATAGATYFAGTVCTAIGFATAGVGGIICGLVVVGGAGVVGGIVGSSRGEDAGELIYKGLTP